MRKLILVVLLGICTLLQAQTGNQDILYLRDGTSVSGKVVKEVPGQTVEIQVGNQILTYRASDVTRIQRGEQESVATYPFSTSVPSQPSYPARTQQPSYSQQQNYPAQSQQPSYPQQQNYQTQPQQSAYPDQQQNYPYQQNYPAQPQQSYYPQQQNYQTQPQQPAYPNQQQNYPYQQNQSQQYQGYDGNYQQPVYQDPNYQNGYGYQQQYNTRPWGGNYTYASFRPTGYRGFAEIGYTPAAGNWKDDRLNLTTSHGYQVNPYFFVGAGVGVFYFIDKWPKEFIFDMSKVTGVNDLPTDQKKGNIAVPVFLNLRAYFMDSNISPYFDAKVGYSPFDLKGFFANPSFGVSYGVTDRIALNLGVGYEMFNVKIKNYKLSPIPDRKGFKTSSENKTLSGISLRFGVEF